MNLDKIKKLRAFLIASDTAFFLFFLVFFFYAYFIDDFGGSIVLLFTLPFLVILIVLNIILIPLYISRTKNLGISHFSFSLSERIQIYIPCILFFLCILLSFFYFHFGPRHPFMIRLPY